jgi:hypothetical protein
VRFDVDPGVIESAKETTRRAWRYEEVDSIPFVVDLGPQCGETIRDVLLDTEAWFSSGVRRIERSHRLLGDDYIPVFEPPWAGYFTVPAMLGATLWWEEDPDAWPAVRAPLVTEIDQLGDLGETDTNVASHMPAVLERLGIACQCLPEDIAIGGVDMMSPLGDVMSIMDQTLFFLSLKRHPEAIRHICDKVTRLQLAIQTAALAVVGDVDRLAALSNWPIWRPEGAKVLVTDDIAGLLSPAVYESFDRPYGDRLLEGFGGGLRHVCGPHPALRLYMTDDPPVHGLNCAFRFSRESLGDLRWELGPRAEEALGRRGHLEVMFERDMALADMVAGFARLADELAPDVVAMPYCQVPADGSVSDGEITGFARAMRAVAEDYAARVRWNG